MRPKSNIIYGLLLYFPFNIVSKTVAFLMNKEIQIYGRENLPNDGAILAINHKFAINWKPKGLWYLFFKTFLRTSYINYENVTHNFVGASLKPFKPIHFFVEPKFFKNEKGKGRSSLTRIIEQIPMIPLSNAINKAKEYLYARENIGIFDGKALNPLDTTKRLAVYLAVCSKKKIVPVSVKTEPKENTRLVNIMDSEVKKLIITYKKPLGYESLERLYNGLINKGKSKSEALRKLTEIVWAKAYED